MCFLIPRVGEGRGWYCVLQVGGDDLPGVGCTHGMGLRRMLEGVGVASLDTLKVAIP